MALVLAAGSGNRFGEDKRQALLPDGRHVLCATLGLVASVHDRWYVILRAGRDEALAEAMAIPAERTLYSDRAAQGMGAALADGVRKLATPATLHIFLGDMPWLQWATARTMQTAAAEAGARGGRWILRPRNQAGPGHPVVFSADWQRQLMALDGDRGARDLLRANAVHVQLVDVPDHGIHADIDIPSDLTSGPPT